MSLKIKPAYDFKIRDPKTDKYLPEEGATVEESLYWLRRLDDGSVELIPEYEEDKGDNGEVDIKDKEEVQ